MEAISYHEQHVHCRCNVRPRSGIGPLEVRLRTNFVHFKITIILLFVLCSTSALPKSDLSNVKQTKTPINSLSADWDYVTAQIFTDGAPKLGLTERKLTNKAVTDAEDIEEIEIVAGGTTDPLPGDAKTEDKASKTNWALLVLLGVLGVLVVACIKCCNWFKSHAKERKYIEDGKLVFSVDKDVDQDYPSSTGTGYNPYETVTSSTYNPYSTVNSSTYNPYNTVTSMLSDFSNVEKKDASTCVKPRDIWRTMRSVRGLSVPDAEELEREGELLGNVVEEVKKLKNCLINPTDSPASSEKNKPLGEIPPGVLVTLKYVDSSDEDLLEGKTIEPSVVLADVEHHQSPPVHRSAIQGEEDTPLLESNSSHSAKSPPHKKHGTHRSHKKRSTVDLSVQCVNTIEAADDRKSPDCLHRSISVSASSRKGIDDIPGKVMRSHLRSSGRKRNISVSFEDEVVHIVDLSSKRGESNRREQNKKHRVISPSKLAMEDGCTFPLPSEETKNLTQSIHSLDMNGKPNIDKDESEVPDSDHIKLRTADDGEESSTSSRSSKINSTVSSSTAPQTCHLSSDNVADLRLNDLSTRGDIILPDCQQSMHSNVVSNCEIGVCDSRTLPPLSCH